MLSVRRVCDLTKTVVLAVPVKLGNFAHRKSMFYIANQEKEFTDRVEAHRAAGTDLAAESTYNFIKDQWRLVPYRVVKCREEWDHFKSEGYKTYFNPFAWTVRGVVVESKFLISLLFFYMFGVMVGRNSMFPLVEPNSPFVEGLKYVNPNTNR